MVALADINLARAAAAAESLEAQYGVKVYAFAFDAADEAQCSTLVGQAVEAAGKLDVLVNCAGVMEWSRAQDYDSLRWDRVLKINLYAVFYVTQAALPHLLVARGSIVNISSAAGLQGVPYAAAYCASKSGVLGLTALACGGICRAGPARERDLSGRGGHAFDPRSRADPGMGRFNKNP